MFQTARVFGSVVVDDLGTAQKFYGETLGLQVSEENGALMLHLAGDHRILVYPKPDHSPASFTILNFPVDDIDQAVDELGAGACRSGTTRASTPMTGGSTAARSVPSPGLPDPAGNVLSVAQERERVLERSSSPAELSDQNGAMAVDTTGNVSGLDEQWSLRSAR